MKPHPRLVVVGDALLDVDVVGTVTRTVPDAPAMVLEQRERRPRPGGAALAAWLAAGRGAEVVLACPLADDAPAAELRALLEPRVRLVGLPDAGGTAVKTRSRAAGQTLLRTDVTAASLPRPAPDRLRAACAGADAVLVSDYGRGLLAEAWCREVLIEIAARVPLVWDPHPRGGAPVPGTLVATPNEGELARFTEELHGPAAPDSGPRGGQTAWVGRSAAALVDAWHTRAVVVTLGERGALLSYGDTAPLILPLRSPLEGVADTCGAGDCLAAALATALAHGDVIDEAVACSVQVAADFVAAGAAAGLRASGGVEQPHPAAETAAAVVDRVREAGGTVVATGGCFDLLHVGHVETLRAARSLGDCLVVLVNADASVRRLKGATRPLVPEQDRARVLAALDCVDAVMVFDEDSPERALRQLRPDIWAKGGDYAVEELPERAVLAEWGGQAVLLPFLAGRSTTRMLETAVARRRR